jgi:hypothetical protein
MKRLAAAFLLLLAWSAVGCGGDDDTAAPVASSSCAELLYEGEGESDVIVVSDLPRRGLQADSTQISPKAGVWKLWRDEPDFAPLDFAQRFTGTFSNAGETISGRWEICHDGTTWEHDFDLTYGKA